MTASFNLEANEIIAPRLYYEHLIYDVLRTMWVHRRLVAAIVIGAVIVASLALSLMGRRYTAEAIIQTNFSRDEQANGMRSHLIATVDATALVESAARIVRSRATASALVDRYGLDRGPGFIQRSFWSRALSWFRSSSGPQPPSNHDLAVDALMRRVGVATEPRS